MASAGWLKFFGTLFFACLCGYLFACFQGIPHYVQFWIGICLTVFGLILSRIRDSALVRLTLMTAGTLAAIRFLMWRFSSTLLFDNPLNCVASVALLVAEIHTALMFITVCFQTLHLEYRSPVPPAAEDFEPTVDIFIATYNEPLEIVRRTVAGALAIPYRKKKIYLLDDGRRQEMLDAAEEFGVNYLTRADNKDYKAGNINNALGKTDGELILFLDADHVPVTSVLEKMLPYFADAKVGLVQAAHRFMNPAPVERNLWLEGRLPSEQEFFFQVVQVGKNYWNAAFFAGSTGIIRRQALVELGGMAKETVTEDAEFTLKMHRRGWKSVYIKEPQSIGLNPESLAAYFVQQRRWARGSTQMLMLDNPLTGPGLTVAQRISYFAGMVHYLFGIPRLTFVVIPLLYLIFNIHSVHATLIDYVIMGLPYLMFYLLSQNYIFQNYRHSFWSDVYEMSTAPLLALYTTLTIFNPRNARFQVTPKGLRRSYLSFNVYMMMPHVILIGLCAVGFLAAVIRLVLKLDPSLTVMNTAWTFYNLIILTAAVMIAIERPESRRSTRVLRELPITIRRRIDMDVSAGGFTQDLNEFGARIKVLGDMDFVNGENIVVTFDWHGELIDVPAKLIRHYKQFGNETLLEMKFRELSNAELCKIIELCYCSESTWSHLRYPGDNLVDSLGEVLSTPVRVVKEVARSRARFPLSVVLPTKLFQFKYWPEKLRPYLQDVGALMQSAQTGARTAIASDFVIMSKEEAEKTENVQEPEKQV